MRTRTRYSAAALGAFAIAAAALGADEPTQTIEAKGLTFQAPKSWKSSPPSSVMRAAQLKVDPTEGDADPAELIVFAFPGGAGSVADNLKRWQEMFVDKEGNRPKVANEKRKAKDVDVTFVEIAGRYVAAVTPGSPQKYDKPDYRLFGAIVETPRVAYFLRMVGPDKTMGAAKPAFDALISSISVGGR